MLYGTQFLQMQKLAIESGYFEKSKQTKYIRKYIGEKGYWVYVYRNTNYNNQEKRISELADIAREKVEDLKDLEADRERVDWDMNSEAGEYQQQHGDKWNAKWEADGKHNEYGNELNKIDEDIEKKKEELRKINDQIGKNDIGPEIHKQSDEPVPAALIQAKQRGEIKGVIHWDSPRPSNSLRKSEDDELEKAKTDKKIIRDDELKAGSVDDYESMSNGEKIAHHYYALQHHDNERKESAKKISEYAEKLASGKISHDDYNKLINDHHINLKKSAKNFVTHCDTVKRLGGVESLDEVEKLKAGNWINNNFSDEFVDGGFKVNKEKVSSYYKKYADIHDKKVDTKK